MSITLDSYKYNFSGSIKSIASKSCAHRLLIAASFSNAPTDIECFETSKDIEATVSCLNSLGASITKENGIFHIVPISSPVSNCEIDCNESGSTLRFLLPILGILGNGASIMSHGRLPERPLSPLYEEMQRHDVSLSPQGIAPLTVSNKMTGGDFNILGNVSSQYITGLLFALPMSDTDSEIRIIGNLESKPYVDITLQVLESFGIKVEIEYPEASEYSVIFKVPANQKYITKSNYTVEGDWSNAAFFLCLGAISENGIETRSLNMASLQGDKAVVEILKAYGADITYKNLPNGLSDVTVKKASLKGINIDAANIPDLVPILAAVASVCDGTTVISNIERLRIKESDRVKTVIDTLTALGADICEKNNTIVINGKPALTGGTIDSANDHRIAMMAGIISAASTGSVTIERETAVSKSYPNFFEDFMSLASAYN